jgi:DNA-binding NarL/FixJ family response regulator
MGPAPNASGDASGDHDVVNKPLPTDAGVPPHAVATEPIRLVIVDDDRRVRQSLSGLMALRAEIEVVGTAGDGASALAMVLAASPDTVLLDLRLPEASDGLGLLAELRDRWPAMRLVAMSVQVSLRASAITAGATAFIPKGGQPEAIGDALVAIARGGAA